MQRAEHRQHGSHHPCPLDGGCAGVLYRSSGRQRGLLQEGIPQRSGGRGHRLPAFSGSGGLCVRRMAYAADRRHEDQRRLEAHRRYHPVCPLEEILRLLHRDLRSHGRRLRRRAAHLCVQPGPGHVAHPNPVGVRLRGLVLGEDRQGFRQRDLSRDRRYDPLRLLA